MLYVDLNLPKGALLSPPAAVEDPGGIVFDASGIELDGEITGWRDLSDQRLARPSKPNEGHARLERIGRRPVMRLRDKVNCGFVLEELALTLPKFSVAVMYASPLGQACTLVTLNPQEGRNYLFLNESDETVELKFRDNSSGLSQPCPLNRESFNLVCASTDGGTMKLAVNGAEPAGLIVPEGLDIGQYDLFIGCRSDRAGISKTLGEAQLARVWIWPNEDVFADGTYNNLVDQWRREIANGI